MRCFSQIYDFMFAPAGTFESGTGACYAHGIDDVSSVMQTPVINPANGLPMISDVGGVDVMGNPYGFNFHDETGSHQTTDTVIQDDGFSECHGVVDMFADQYFGHDSSIGFESFSCDQHSGLDD